MKIILISAIIACCGILQIAANEATMLELRYELIKNQLALMNVTESLLNLQKEMLAPENVFDTSTEFHANLTTAFNNARRAIEEKAEDAIANGKSVEVCVDPALANLTALKETAFDEYAQAGENITRFTNDFRHQIDQALEMAVTIGVSVFSMPKTCHNNDTDIVEACFTESIKNTTEGLKAYQETVNNILAAAESDTTALNMMELVIEFIATIVIIPVVTEAEMKAIQQKAIECIENL